MYLMILLCLLVARYELVTSLNNGSEKEKEGKDVTPLLLISFDGFRADYLRNYPLPNLKKFFSGGVIIEELTNVFITKTFPNHYSLVTGLYAESHGILSSSMYDDVTKKEFSVKNDTDPFWWNEATPIWVSVQNQNYKSAAAMWPGTDVTIQNHTLPYFFKYDHSISFRDRLGNITKWMIEDKLVKFSALYWEEPDHSGHVYGPENKTEMGRVLKEVDDQVGFLMEHLKQKELWGKINVIITSDHGMVQCSENKLIKLDECVNRSSYMLIDNTPVAAILPLAEHLDLFKNLSNCSIHMKAYMKDAIPDRLHYKNNRRIQPIILVADEGWTIVQQGKLPRLGDHGYDNSLPSMHPFMVANGPAFRKDYHMTSGNSVDIYPLMCHLLGIPEMPNNGTFSRVRCVLISENCISLAAVVGIVIGVFVVLTIILFLLRLMVKRESSRSQPFGRLELQDEDDDEPLLE